MKAILPCLALVGLVFAACAPAKAPKAPQKPPPPAESEKPRAAEPKPEPVSEPKPTRGALEMLLLPDQMYSLSFSSSEAGEKAEQRCHARHKDNPKQKNQCMKLARSKIKDDVLHFTKDANGYLFWTTSEQRGNKLKRRKNVGFKVLKETENSVQIKVKGLAKPVTIGVPNDYSIEVPSAKHGKLVYEAKVEIKTDE